MYFRILLNEDEQLATDNRIKSKLKKKSERKHKIKIMSKCIIQDIVGDWGLFYVYFGILWNK